MFKARWFVLFALSAVLFAACGGSGDETTTPPAGTTSGPAATTSGPATLTVGVSWNNYNEPRWAQWDEPAIQEALAAVGATYISADARFLGRAAALRR